MPFSFLSFNLIWLLFSLVVGLIMSYLCKKVLWIESIFCLLICVYYTRRPIFCGAVIVVKARIQMNQIDSKWFFFCSDHFIEMLDGIPIVFVSKDSNNRMDIHYKKLHLTLNVDGWTLPSYSKRIWRKVLCSMRFDLNI